MMLSSERRGSTVRFIAALLLATVPAACASTTATLPPGTGNAYPQGRSDIAPRTVDESSGGPCSVSADGFVWYALPGGVFPPIDFAHVRCAAPGTLDAGRSPARPAWARPTAPTHAIFVATSLEETYSIDGMNVMARDAHAAGLPITWLVGNIAYFGDGGALYNQLHASAGDDVQLEQADDLYAAAARDLPWYVPSVSVEGAGRERHVRSALARGNGGFWGITWNSHGTDNTSDEGAPWGTYCADITSYKRPSPTGDCSLVSFEWTARDLTRAYFANTNAFGYSAEAAFSTDPDDALLRGAFGAGSAGYETALIDAYAAAGVSQPIVVMSMQEAASEEMRMAEDDPVLNAIYREAKTDGMTPLTLHAAVAAARGFSARPRAIAFPYIDGGRLTTFDGAPFTPATIDYHDATAGMTFVAGHTLPARVFRYADDPISTFDMPLVALVPGNPAYPALTGVTAGNGMLAFHFAAPVAIHFGIALWSDPARLAVSGASVTAAGHAGAVVTFDLPAGASTQYVVCAGCTSTTLPYSL